MATYTPLKTNEAPVLGTSGDAVKNLQNQLNSQNANTPGYKPLTVDGLYGPLTQAATQAGKTSALITTSSQPRQETNTNLNAYNQYKNALTAETPGDYKDLSPADQGYLKVLDSMAARSDTAQQALTNLLKSKYQTQAAQTAKDYQAYQKGVETAGIRSGAAQYTPELFQGTIQTARNQARQALVELDQKEMQALAEAEQAKADKDYLRFNEKMKFVKDARAEKLDKLKEMYTIEHTAEKEKEDREFKLREFNETVRMNNAQIANIYSQIAERNKTLAGANFVTPPIMNPTTGKPDPKSNLASVIDASGAKDNTNLQNIFGVVSSLQDLADLNPEGVFKGASVFPRLTPGFLASQEQISNKSSIEAINLKVQQWASGAALTDAQTKQVEKITPRKGDSDNEIQKKINALSNFMLSQAGAVLGSQGIKYSPQPVDFFKDFKKVSNAELLNTIPGNTTTQTSGALSNEQFFNSLAPTK